MKEKLEGWKKEFYEDTAKVSDIVRNLGFVGIAVIWIFNQAKVGDAVKFNLPSDLILPLGLLITGLLLDVFQLLWRSGTIYRYYRKMEKKFDKGNMTEDAINNATLPRYIANGSWTFFYSKLITILLAYAFILKFLMK
jgi:hypothetical protein